MGRYVEKHRKIGLLSKARIVGLPMTKPRTMSHERSGKVVEQREVKVIEAN